MNKTFAFIAITILFLASFISFAGNADAKEVKTVEFPVKILQRNKRPTLSFAIFTAFAIQIINLNKNFDEGRN